MTTCFSQARREWPSYMRAGFSSPLNGRQPTQEVVCTGPDCEAVGQRTRSGRLPVDQFQRRMERKGWTFGRNRALCPDCSPKRRKATVTAPPPAEAIEEPRQPEPQPEVPMPAQHVAACNEGIRVSLTEEGSVRVLRALLRDEHREHLNTDRVQIAVTDDGMVEIYPATHDYAPTYTLNSQRVEGDEVWRIEAELETPLLIPSSTSMVDVYRLGDEPPYLVILPINEQRPALRLEDACTPHAMGPVRTRTPREPEIIVPRVPPANLTRAADHILKHSRVDDQVRALVEVPLPIPQPVALPLTFDQQAEEIRTAMQDMYAARMAKARSVWSSMSPAERRARIAFKRALREGRVEDAQDLATTVEVTPPLEEQPVTNTANLAVVPAQPVQMSDADRLAEIKAAFARVNELVAASGGRIVPRIEDGILRASVTVVTDI